MLLVDDGLLIALGSGFDDVLFGGWVELVTEFLFTLLLRLNGFEVVRFVVVELGWVDGFAEELGLLESSPDGFDSFVLELSLELA